MNLAARPRRFGAAFVATAWAIERAGRVAHLSETESAILHEIMETDGLTMTELADAIASEPKSTQGALARLRDKIAHVGLRIDAIGTKPARLFVREVA